MTRGIKPAIEKPCRVVAILSGGMDSFSYMVKWLSRGCKIHVFTFNYGQKAQTEIEAAKRIIERVSELARKLDGWGSIVEHRVIDMSFMSKLWSGTQLTDQDIEVEREYTPSVVVPIRNAVMMSIATAYAYTLTAKYPTDNIYVIIGSHYDDIKPRDDTWEPLYPDCSPECLEALQTAFRLCHFRGERRIEIWSPSREGMTKYENLRSSYELIGDIIYSTWSCYLSGKYHCGRCESCINRHIAFKKSKIPDCTQYEHPPGDPDEFVKTEDYYIHKSCPRIT